MKNWYKNIIYVLYKYYINKGEMKPHFSIQALMALILNVHILQIYLVLKEVFDVNISEWLKRDIEIKYYAGFLYVLILVILKANVLTNQKIEKISTNYTFNYNKSKYYVLLYIIGSVFLAVILALLFREAQSFSPSLIGG